ncbi:MAG: hypothetical protein KC425_11860 [Anaerolineales bacterium]|nr:hypothetical protein [Anaerolineales bacterium]
METQNQIVKILDQLPAVAQDELLAFLAYLQFKYDRTTLKEVVPLGGSWGEYGLDVTDADVRALRKRVTEQATDGV